MTRILFLSKDRLFEKVIELVLYNYDAEVKLVKDDKNVSEELKLFDVVVIDSDFNNNIKSIIDNAVSLKKPVILLENVFDSKIDSSEYKNVITLSKPFEDLEFIKTLKNITNLNLKLKDGEAVMSKPEEIKEVKEKAQEEQGDDILDLTDIVEEAAEEVSDILSTKDKEDTAEVSDILSEKVEEKVADDVSDILSTNNSEEETINLNEFDFSEPSEPSTSEETTKLEESGELAESEASIESLKPTESTSPLETTELKETAESTEFAKSEDTLQPEQEIKKEVEKGVDTVSHEVKKEEIFLDKLEEKAESLPELEETQEEIFEEMEEDEDINIPVDEETRKLAQEIENGEFEKEEEEEFPFKSEFSSDSHKPIDVSIVEMKLLEASGKILEAIEEATVEIARGIAKVTPKIIEEVANEIIPKIAKKILTEELEKTKKK